MTSITRVQMQNSQPEIEYIIKSEIKAAKRHDFDIAQSWTLRHLQRFIKKLNAKFAHRPELTLKTYVCALESAKGLREAFEKAYYEAKDESAKERARKHEEQKERVV